MSKLLEAMLGHLEKTGLEPGEVHVIEVRHDDDCPMLDGKPCNCTPVIETGARVDRKYGGG